MKITLKQLTIFKAIHDNGQISKAAQQLHMSVPAVSMALKELEGSLGTRLFERSSNGLTTNDNGEVILPYANEMLSKGTQLEQMFAERNAVGGTIKIGSSKTAGNYILSRKIPQFKKSHPLVDIKLVINNSLTIEKMVSEKELDLGFVDAKPGLNNLKYEQWIKDKICLVTSCDNPILEQTITAELLSEQLWVLDSTMSVSRLRNTQLLRSAKININNELSMNTMGAIKRAIGTGIGVSVLPYLAVKEEIRRGEIVELELAGWDFQRKYWSISRNDEALSPLLEEFIRFCNA
ncbi:LysR family transcriptional regulator [Shewanella sp. 1_MG-2023]|uniref:LysR family transcriptional regulator n=1 Tax=Shewanella electrodiphila TaxID=934143 RepID=A0ABT0KRA3_9GAMM|nr:MULTISPECIES: LysR family transcriptional regulator [Shewanella]MCC4831558.1 LysR family transcriptional regulator [Shewanella sp. 10N.7]MCL1046139.1 LysR family transcriptional regulator [Shewanella electrodiphila]MDO6612214.1 LysR family transcriptional regulator [Shewanella sp. 7_MG-2023]MDO6772068.1 LysR family transcriptional regulator [Shewanella sp. 2_MG-2023]MDO6795808.1 LysR family transcriptional regulator [Shewanella sp. 1_MG-2023]